MTQAPPPPPPAAPGPGVGMRPHRGVMILVFGILGFVCCFIFGIVAWVMGNGDLEAMASGQMDPSGEGLTKAGKILGMVCGILNLVGIVLWFVLVGMAMLFGTVTTP